MSTTAPRTLGAHRRRLDASQRSLTAAEQLHRVLAEALAANPALERNDYFTDAMQRADELVGEMSDDLDDAMTSALEDGYGPEDFE